MNETLEPNSETPAWHPWLLPGLLPGLLALLVLGSYFARLTDLTLRGEEPRRAQVAAEMLRTGDWIVPRQQGQLDLSRPPLASYPIAVLAMMTGEIGPFAVRFPSVVAMLLTTLLVFWYSRNYLSHFGAFVAACAFATAVQVLETGRLAETEALFTLLVSASLLVWHAGYVRRWPAGWTWMAGYSLAALAGLAKGLHGPVYLTAVSWTWIAMRRDWQFLFSRAHLAGVVGLLAILGCWQVPYLLATDWQSSVRIWMDDAATGYSRYTFFGTLAHLATFPLEVLACLLPWSILLPILVDRAFRRSLRHLRPLVKFQLVALAVTFPSVWFAMNAGARSFMPMYPCLAVLIGAVSQRFVEWQPDASWKRWWPRAQWASIAAMVIIACAMLFSTLAPWLREVPTTLGLLVALEFTVLSLVLAGVVFWSIHSGHPWRSFASVYALAAFLGLTYNVVVISALVKSANNSQQQVAQLKQRLPPDANLVSLNLTHHLFAYHYGDPISVVEWPASEQDLPTDVEYFCFQQRRNRKVQLPFAWEPVAVISCDRNKRNPPHTAVVVGRRVTSTARQRNAEVR